jgi:histidinol-phosphate aminotransferase
MDKIVESLVKKSVKQISPYVPGKPIEVLQRDYNIDPSKIIKLASNENPLGVSPKVKEAVTRYLDNIYRYPEGSGYYLKNKLSEILKVSPEKIILGSGSSEIISMAIDTFVNPGEEIIYPYPSFLIYKILALKTNATPVEIPLNEDFSYDLNKFLDKITSNTKMIILCNPNNPSGTIIFEDQLEEFINNVPDRVIIIVDEAYIEYVENKKFGKTLNYIDKKNIIISRTFSKIYGLAGLRMGTEYQKKI